MASKIPRYRFFGFFKYVGFGAFFNDNRNRIMRYPTCIRLQFLTLHSHSKRSSNI